MPKSNPKEFIATIVENNIIEILTKKISHRKIRRLLIDFFLSPIWDL